MADTPSPGVTPPESYPPASDRPREDDLVIDVAGFARLLWRFRFAIMIATLAGGALGVAYARSLPPTFLGSSRINLTVSPATGPGAGQLARFQALVRDPALVAQALTEAGLSDLSPDAVAAVVTARVTAPGTILLVEARWSDAAIAGRLASALSRSALAVLKAQHQMDSVENLAAREKSWADAEQQVQKASAAFVEAWLSRRIALARIDPSVRQELEETLEELRRLRTRIQLDARLRAVEVGVSVAEAIAAASDLRLRSQLRLAELEARRDYLVLRMSGDRPHHEIIDLWSELDARQKQLEVDIATAREVSTEAKSAWETAQADVARGLGMELVEPSFAPGRPGGIGSTAFLARGMATGLMLAVFAVFFLRGMLTNLFGRRI